METADLRYIALEKQTQSLVASPLCTQIYPLEIVTLEFILIFIYICTCTTVHMSICKFTQVEYFTLVLRDPNTLFIVVCCLCITIPISVVNSTKKTNKIAQVR